jgi:hypothetical protein
MKDQTEKMRRQVTEFRRRFDRDRIVPLVNETLVPLYRTLQERPRYTELSEVLFNHFSNEGDPLSTEPLAENPPFSKTETAWTHLYLNSSELGDIPKTIDRHDQLHESLYASVEGVLLLYRNEVHGETGNVAVEVGVPLTEGFFLLPFDAEENIGAVVSQEPPEHLFRLAFWEFLRILIWARMEGEDYTDHCPYSPSQITETLAFWDAWIAQAVSQEGYEYVDDMDKAISNLATNLEELDTVRTDLTTEVRAAIQTLVEEYSIQVDDITDDHVLRVLYQDGFDMSN